VVVVPYDDNNRAMKLLHSLNHTIWNAKAEAILEFDNYETLVWMS
jgi:hypothetical protein